MTMLQACLNGARTREEHPAIPRTPDELAREGRAAVEAGAKVLHLHPYDENGEETFAADACAAALQAVRAACPGIPISLSTSATIDSHPQRLESIGRWTELPDLVTANQGEDGIVELCELLGAREIGIEAGLLHLDDALRFVISGLAGRCVRVLVEPLDEDPAVAVTHAAAMEQVLADAGVSLEQVHHGDGVATWHVMARAVSRGHGIRAGLEDTTKLPDGRLAPDNASLVELALGMIEGTTALDFDGGPATEGHRGDLPADKVRCKDGHHRVSVAAALGYDVIDANVTEIRTRLPAGGNSLRGDIITKRYERIFRARVPLAPDLAEKWSGGID